MPVRADICPPIVSGMLYQTDRPRAHHYDFGHRLLPGLAIRGRLDFLELASRALLDELLRNWWRDVGEQLPAEERLVHDGLRAELTAAGGAPVVLITMPEACHAAEAHFVALIPGAEPGAWRCLTLEYTWTLDDRPATVLGGWSAGGHVNYGDGPVPDRRAFLAALDVLAAGNH
jgi:hypothetical protein